MEEWVRGEGIKGSTNSQLQNNHGDVQYSTGKGVVKELNTHDPWT